MILFHAAVNATASHLMPAFSAPARDTIWLIFAALNVIVALAVALTPGFRRPNLDEIEAAPYEPERSRTDATVAQAPPPPSAT